MELSNFSTELQEKLTSEENVIIGIKYKSIPFGKMDAAKIVGEVEKLLLKIHVITGWQLPIIEFQNALIEQMSKKLFEAYPLVNVDEVEFAFRNRDIDVKDWGKSFSITLLDEVMQPYLERRYELSKLEEHIKKPNQIEYKEDISDNAMGEWIDSWVSKVKTIQSIFFIPTSFYGWLDKNKLINTPKEKKNEYLTVNAVALREGFLFEQIDTSEGQKLYNEFLKMKKDGCFIGREVDKLKDIAKRLIVFDYLKSKQNVLGE